MAVDQPEKFVGLLCARVDVSSAVVRFANAGLTPPLVRRADGRLEELRESGMLLGVSDAARYWRLVRGAGRRAISRWCTRTA